MPYEPQCFVSSTLQSDTEHILHSRPRISPTPLDTSEIVPLSPQDMMSVYDKFGKPYIVLQSCPLPPDFLYYYQQNIPKNKDKWVGQNPWQVHWNWPRLMWLDARRFQFSKVLTNIDADRSDEVVLICHASEEVLHHLMARALDDIFVLQERKVYAAKISGNATRLALRASEWTPRLIDINHHLEISQPSDIDAFHNATPEAKAAARKRSNSVTIQTFRTNKEATSAHWNDVKHMLAPNKSEGVVLPRNAPVMIPDNNSIDESETVRSNWTLLAHQSHAYEAIIDTGTGTSAISQQYFDVLWHKNEEVHTEALKFRGIGGVTTSDAKINLTFALLGNEGEYLSF